MEIRPFTKTDWDAFAGAEGTDPKIGELKIVTDKEEETVVVADATAVQIYPVWGTDRDCWLTLEVKSQKLSEVIAGSLHDGITELELLNDYGFVWQNV